MRHDPDRCWYVLPDGVTADEITSFVEGDKPLTPELMDLLIGMLKLRLVH